jgi:hypothetical protein
MIFYYASTIKKYLFLARMLVAGLYIQDKFIEINFFMIPVSLIKLRSCESNNALKF